jgi:hypothetical protein
MEEAMLDLACDTGMESRVFKDMNVFDIRDTAVLLLRAWQRTQWYLAQWPHHGDCRLHACRGA